MDLEKHVPAQDRDAAKRFVRGGFWRGFLTKYEESNNIHKKMLHVSVKRLHAAWWTDDRFVAKRKAHHATPKRRRCWTPSGAGQYNCAYWRWRVRRIAICRISGRRFIANFCLEAENLQADKAFAGR